MTTTFWAKISLRVLARAQWYLEGKTSPIPSLKNFQFSNIFSTNSIFPQRMVCALKFFYFLINQCLNSIHPKFYALTPNSRWDMLYWNFSSFNVMNFFVFLKLFYRGKNPSKYSIFTHSLNLKLKKSKFVSENKRKFTLC